MTTTSNTTGPNKLLIALVAVGAVLLLTITSIVFLLIGQNSAGAVNASDQQPISAPTSETPAPTSEPTDGTTTQPVTGETSNGSTQNTGTQNTGGTSGTAPAPVDNSLRFTSFNANLQVACDPTGQAEYKAQPQISWTAANVTAVYWTPSNQDATADNGYVVSASGNQNTMSDSKGAGERYEFPCNHRQTFDTTVTIYGANGQKVSKHVTFTDINWNANGDAD
ncbi:hypothetical protein BH11ACT3_BH11ACT3_19810 [soil metagenome]